MPCCHIAEKVLFEIILSYGPSTDKKVLYKSMAQDRSLSLFQMLRFRDDNESVSNDLQTEMRLIFAIKGGEYCNKK